MVTEQTIEKLMNLRPLRSARRGLRGAARGPGDRASWHSTSASASSSTRSGWRARTGGCGRLLKGRRAC